MRSQFQIDPMGNEAKDPVSSLLEKLQTLPKTHSSNHSIYQVPEHIREVSRQCYEPAIVSIGPIHYKKTSLNPSREFKLKHLQCFLERENQRLGGFDMAFRHYMSIVEEWHDEARSYYEEKINLTREEFIEIMMLDAAFVICYFVWLIDIPDLNLPIHPMDRKTAWGPYVNQDLLLQDNQLPFFVLEALYDNSFGRLRPQIITFKDLTCGFIGRIYFPDRKAAPSIGNEKVRNAEDIKHLVHFLRIYSSPPERSRTHKNDEDSLHLPLKSTLKELKATGVKFKAVDGENLLDIKFENGLLQIPTFVIQDTTEAFLRNIIVFEQCRYFFDSYFTDYALFLDALIDTPEDVKILVKHGIIKNSLGSEQQVATMVNGLTQHITLFCPKFYYSEISQRLNEHASKRWNKWRAILKRDYFNHPWSSLSVCYLLILLVLTILQVYTGFKQ